MSIKLNMLGIFFLLYNYPAPQIQHTILKVTFLNFMIFYQSDFFDTSNWSNNSDFSLELVVRSDE